MSDREEPETTARIEPEAGSGGPPAEGSREADAAASTDAAASPGAGGADETARAGASGEAASPGVAGGADERARAVELARARREAIDRVLMSDDHGRGRQRAPRSKPARQEADPAEGPAPGRWRWRLALFVLVVVAGLVGWGFGLYNHRRFYLVCFPGRVEPQQGLRWPWGRGPMEGEAYRPVTVPKDRVCGERLFASREELDAALCDLLLERIAADVSAAAPKLDAVGARIDQARRLLHGRAEQRARLNRLAGALAYRRGRAEVDQAAATIKEAISQFRAALRRGKPVARDSALWIRHLEQLLGHLQDPRRPVPPAPATAPAGPPPSQPASRPDAPPPPLGGGVLL